MAISNTIELAPMWTLLLYCSMIGCNIYYLGLSLFGVGGSVRW